jgi:hypothetical protein
MIKNILLPKCILIVTAALTGGAAVVEAGVIEFVEDDDVDIILDDVVIVDAAEVEVEEEPPTTTFVVVVATAVVKIPLIPTGETERVEEEAAEAKMDETSQLVTPTTKTDGKVAKAADKTLNAFIIVAGVPLEEEEGEATFEAMVVVMVEYSVDVEIGMMIMLSDVEVEENTIIQERYVSIFVSDSHVKRNRGIVKTRKKR